MKDRIDRLFHTTLLALFALAGAVSGQNLKTVQLPAGSVGGFDIGFPGWNGSNRTKYANPLTELDSNGRPYDGIRFVGAGRGRTHIVPDYAGTTSGDSTIVIGKGCGIVQFEKLTLHAASRKAIHVGEIWDQVSALEPSTLALRRVTVTAGRPALGSGNSTVWGILTYNADIDFEDVRFDLKWTAEHGLYAHGFNKRGIRWVRVDVKAVGAEGLKVATRPEEVAFVPNATILVKQCTFTNWLQPHSWRGGAGMVLQGSSAARIILDRTRFR